VGTETELVSATLSDATTTDGVPRTRAEWTATLDYAETEDVLYFEAPLRGRRSPQPMWDGHIYWAPQEVETQVKLHALSLLFPYPIAWPPGI